jgi:signal transduction histidine kinase
MILGLARLMSTLRMGASCRPGPACPVTEGAACVQEPAAAGSERLTRHMTWLHEREATRTRAREQALAVVDRAAADLALCAEMAGSQQKLQALLDETLDRIRWVQRGLRGDLSPLGAPLPEAAQTLRQGLEGLVSLVEDASFLQVDARIDARVDGCLSEAQRTHVLYIAQEALANAVRHSGGAQVALRAAVENRRFVMSISDDGRGFEARAPRPSGEQGLDHMQFRAEAAWGLLQVESARDAGTIITVTIPLDGALGQI